MTRWRGVVLWCALLAGLLVCVHGLATHRPWQQGIWTETGWRRLSITAVAFTVIWVIGLWRRLPVVPALAAILAALTVVVTGPVALLAVMYFGLSSWALGRLLLRRESRISDAGSELLSGLLGVAVWQALVGLAAHFPVNNGIVYALVFAVPIAVQPRLLVALIPILRAANWRVQPPWTAGLTLFALFAHWAAAMRLEVSADGLAMHLVVPGSVAQHGRWWYDVERYSWAVMPLGGDWAYTAVYLLGGEWAAHLLNFALLLSITALVWWVASRMLPSAEAALVAGLFTATPLVHLVTGNLFVENFQAAMLVGALVSLNVARERGDGRLLIVAATLMGAAASAKFGTFAYAAPLLIVAAFASRGLRVTHRMMAALAFVTLAAIPYATAFVLTGNPVFPFMNAVFQSHYFDTVASFRDARFATPLSWRTPYEAVFETRRFLEAQDGALGYHYLVLAPICIVALVITRQRPSLLSTSLFVGSAGAALTWAGTSNVRYTYPALPMLAIAVAGTLASIRDRHSTLYRAVSLVSIACIVTGTLTLATSGWWKDFFVNPFHEPEQREYLAEFAPGRVLVQFLNERHPNRPVLLLVNGQTAGLHGRVYLNSWHNETFYRRLRAASSRASVAQLLTSEGIHQLVVPNSTRMGELPNPVLRDFVVECTFAELEVNGYAAASVRPACGLGQ